MRKAQSLVLAWLAAGLSVALSGCASPPGSRALRTISVVGHGSVKSEPDTFVLYVGVSERDHDLDKARRAVAERSARVIEAVRTFPINTDRTRTTSFDVDPDYDYQTRQFQGYRVDQRIEVHLRDLSRSEELMLTTLRAGGNSLSVDFVIEKGKEALVERARELAVADAREQARRMAAAIGETVGAALDIGRPGGDDDSSGGMNLMQASRSGSSNTPADTQRIKLITPREVEVQVTVFARFALGGE